MFSTYFMCFYFGMILWLIRCRTPLRLMSYWLSGMGIIPFSIKVHLCCISCFHYVVVMLHNSTLLFY